MKPKLIVTADGSHSLYLEHLDEHYHSIHGAVNEAQHVFIKNGLDCFLGKKDYIKIFEMGFGTGLNALVAKLWSDKNSISIDYTGIEANPLSVDDCSKLNYLHELGADNYASFFQSIHSVAWEERQVIDKQFSLLKLNQKIEDSVLSDKYDIIFFDAFGPRAQHDMWSTTIFQKLFDALNLNGVFVTYCAKGQVRRDLESVGFKIERLKGPPGKREMLRGTKVI